MIRIAQAFGLALLSAIALAGCDKAVTGGNANASGSPGTGNATTVTAPVVADSPPGGSSGAAGSAPHPGSSGGDAMPGVTGKGTSDPSGRSQSAQVGVGTTGGLGGNSGLGMTGSFPPGQAQGAAGAGNSNRTSNDAAGQR